MGFSKVQPGIPSTNTKFPADGYIDIKTKPEKWSMGVLNDRETEEVPGK